MNLYSKNEGNRSPVTFIDYIRIKTATFSFSNKKVIFV